MLSITLSYTPISEMLACNKNITLESIDQVHGRNLWDTVASNLTLSRSRQTSR